MKKNILVFLLMCSMVISVAAPALAADTVTATPDSKSITIDSDVSVMLPIYNIDGDKYFRLRDLAYMLSGTKKQFEVEWDGANKAIILTSGEEYTVIGIEMTDKNGIYKSAAPTSSKIYLDGKEVQFAAYYIEGNNYFKLPDIGKVFDFGVEWDDDNHTFIINTSKEYTSDPQEQISSYLSELFTEAYEPYYNGLHYAISNYEETILDGEYTSTFLWTMYHLDNGLDIPTDFGKEQESNWFLQVTAKTTDDRLDTTTIVTLADNSLFGPPTYQIQIDDFFPSVENGAIPKQHSTDYRDYGIDYDVTEMNFDQFPFNKLVAYYLGADAAYAEGSNEELYQRFLENPRTVIIYITLVGDNLTRGDVPVKNALCQALASADVFWHDISDSFIEILEQYSEVYQSGDRADVLALIKTEHEAAIIRYNNH